MKSARFVRVSLRVCPSVVRSGVAAFLILIVTTLAWSQQSASTQLSKTALAALRTPPQVVTGAATVTGHYTANPKLRLTIALRPPNPEQEAEFLRALQDKTSAQYHQFLSQANWIARFSPSEADEQAVMEWATSQGFTITHRFPNRLLVDVEAPISAIETALGVTINSYSLNGASYFSNDRDPSLPASVANIITSVQGLNNIQRMQTRKSAFTLPEPDYVPGPVVAEGTAGHGNGSHAALKAAMATKAKQAKNGSNITNGFYDPTDIYNSNAYNYNALQALGHCCNPNNNSSGSLPQGSIALAAFGAFAGSDITGFQSQYPYLAYFYQPIYIDGTPACCGDEVTLDTEWSTATSNSFGSYLDTAEVFVYEGANENNGTFTDIYNQMVSDGHARVFSTSWSCTEFYGCDSGTMDSRDSIFSEMVGEGWTLMAASGDRGATDDCSDRIDVSFPASDPNVIGVGGTYLQLYSNSTYDYETGWQGGTGSGSCSHNNGGSGGGCSAYYAAPGFQTSPYCGSGSRSTPDISLNASHGQNYYYNGSLQGVGGTSISSPMVAGFMAQEDAYLLSLGNICGVNNGTLPCGPMGNANYTIYYDGYNSGYAPHYPFYDITSGCNSNDVTLLYGLGYYCAGTGYDAVTGWGTFNALQFAWMINYSTAADEGAPYITFGGPTTGKWYNTDQLIDWDVTDTGGNYPPTGVAGFSQAWDADPGDVFSEPTPGQGNSFYSGPQHVNSTFGCTDLSGALCSGGVSQGCHTVNVRAWDNMGLGSGDYTYGPVCYDTVAPHTTATLSGTSSGGTYTTAVKVTLTATDPSPGSGIASTVYQVNGGTVTTYTAPFTVSTAGAHTITFHSTDVAGNVEGTETANFSITSKTTTGLTASPNPSASGQFVTFTATVTPTFSGTPTGTVTFKNGTTNIGTSTLSGGVAKFSTKTLAVGSHSITAVYNGATYFTTSTSSAVTQVVENATTTTLVSSLNPAEFGQYVKFTATVTSTSSGTPTGTVTFKNGTTVLGTSNMSGGAASLFINTLAVNTHPITAVYSGNATFSTSTSAVLSQVINKAGSTTKVVSSANPSTVGETVTFTATVKSTTTGTPAGSVTFKDGTTTLGTRALSGGVATLAIKTLAAGTHSITAVYVGNFDYTTSTSAVLSQKVNAAASTTP
jgi:hypothetical protein